MSELNNADYYRRRADEARAHADDATLPEVRRVHLEMAARYDELLAEAQRSEKDGVRRQTVGVVDRYR